jgi:hypothetical protein
MPWWVDILIASVISVVVAVAVPLLIEYVRRPILYLELDDEPVVSDQWCIVHVRVMNLAMAERGRVARFLGRWLTALPAHGCSVQIYMNGPDGLLMFEGKWTSRHEPISTDLIWDGSQLQRIDRYDPQKLPGIHEVTLQPGDVGDLIAIAIRERGATNAYAYWSERIYADAGGRPFPEHPDAELPPGSYRLEVHARAGEVRSDWMSLILTVEEETDLLALEETEPG